MDTCNDAGTTSWFGPHSAMGFVKNGLRLPLTNVLRFVVGNGDGAGDSWFNAELGKVEANTYVKLARHSTATDRGCTLMKDVQQSISQKTKRLMWLQVWHSDCSTTSYMNYEMMKALMEASREELEVQRNPKLVQITTQDSRTDWKYVDYAAKERLAA